MKKITIALLTLICSQPLFSQSWLDVGLKGGYGANLLYNKNFFDDGTFTPKVSFGYMYGGKIGMNINSSHAITIDIGSSVFSQSFAYSLKNPDSTKTDYIRKVGFNSLNFLLMYKKTANSSYIEIGPQFSLVTKASYSDNSPLVQPSSFDVSANLVPSYFSAVVGFGGYLMGTDDFGVSFGVRVAYCFNDIISSTGQLNNFPSVVKYPTYKPSNPVSAMFVLSFDYDLFYIAHSGGNHKRSKILMF